LYYRARVTKTAWYLHKIVKYRDQHARIEDPGIISHSYNHLIFDKVPKTYFEEKTASSTNGVEKTGHSCVEDWN
jgi:hypothetical protein